MFISEARSVSIRGCLGPSVGRGFKVNPEGLTESSVTPLPPPCRKVFWLHTFYPEFIALFILNQGLPSCCFCHFGVIQHSFSHGSGFVVGAYLVKLNCGGEGGGDPRSLGGGRGTELKKTPFSSPKAYQGSWKAKYREKERKCKGKEVQELLDQ